ncbi:hypothetical protein NIES4102_32920 [Chondrocystis sp. NIES-4102]|nr:hypothetical protein NIES4102_32920 [Chondrocystis sp. NIES-4102]
MNHQSSPPMQTARHLQLWIYLLPVIGIIPALKTLYFTPNDQITTQDQKKASRLAISLALIWLSSYTLLSLGAANNVGIISFRLLYTNALITTGYFVCCTYLMLRLSNKNLP